MSLRSTFNKYQTKLGRLGGEYFNIYRPDYSVIDNAIGDPIIEDRMFRAAAQANKFAEPTISGAPPYNVFGKREGIRAGDVLIPQELGTGTPVLTVATISPQKAMSAFMTDQVGKITEDLLTNVFTDVRFAWLPITFPGSSLEEEMAGSMAVSTRKAVIFKREGIRRGMRLVDAGDDGYVWGITDLIILNNVIVLNLQKDKK